MSCQSDELSSLPLLFGCPGDEEWFLVGNAEGGLGVGKYARRRYADIKRCITTSVALPYVGVVDRGNPNDPISGQTTFQNDLIKNLGANNAGGIQIVYGELLRSSFGINKTFNYDPTSGTIDLNWNGDNEQWFPGNTLFIDRNQ